jgi:pyridoxamine 5'-phosphate oxidase
VDLADVAALREANQERGLTEADLPADPVELFRSWQADVVASGLPEPEAMVLATCGNDGQPRARNVLLRGLDERGFVWFTSYNSAKATQLDANPAACLLFSWFAIGRQVIVTGRVRRITGAESDAYWATRPLGSQLATWTSKQSEVIPGREWLTERYAGYEARFEGGPVPRPDHWGGYRLTPETYEFWNGRPMRLHDRFRYVRAAGSAWRTERLAP